MTLVITVASHRGLWQASDHRLSAGSRTVDDSSMKHVRLQAQDGKAIIAYAGLGKVGDTPISDWIRKLLRGSKRSLDEHLGILKEASDRKLTPFCRKLKMPHTFSIAAFRDGCPTFYGITNSIRKEGRIYIGDEFQCARFDLGSSPKAMVINAEGTGVKALPDPDAIENMIRGTIRRRAKKPSLGDDVMAVLARLNWDASQHKKCNGTVSPHCVVTFLESPDAGFHSKFCGWDPDANHPVFQDLAAGHDMTGIIEALMPAFRRMAERFRKRKVVDVDIDELNEALRKRDFKPTDKL